MTKLKRAAQHIGAVRVQRGRWAHYADETRSWWCVSSDNLRRLCDYLDHSDPQIARDGYSHWCAAGLAVEMPEGWEPEQ